MNVRERNVIYAQDIMVFTGRSRSYAYKVMRQVRKHYGKLKHQLVTIQEFAEFHAIPVNDLRFSLIEKARTK